MTRPGTISRIRRFAALLLAALLFAALWQAAPLRARASGKVVRVGWYESPFNTMDQFGRRSGYAYEYQRKIAAYTGWTYEYVEGSWLELEQMLERGEIDLMSDISYTAERAEKVLYPSLPMGTEDYFIYIAPDNSRISADDIATLNSKRVGVTRSSIQSGIFLEWERMQGIEAELVETTGSEEESLKMLQRGRLDAFITVDAYAEPEIVVPVCKIGSSDFYFAVNRDRSDLLAELDLAMNRIQDENRYYNQQLFEKYLRTAGASLYLSAGEKEWLEGHGAIRVGYQDNYLAFCAADPRTGELTGALGDYLSYASDGLLNASLSFEPVAYATATAAIEAMMAGEVDCVFPANLADCDGEQIGVVMTPPLMRTEMLAVVRAADQKDFARREQVTVAVNEGNYNYDMFLVDHFPSWKAVHFEDTQTCLTAVSAGSADCLLISNYRFSNIERQCDRLRLRTVYTGVDMDYRFAVREGDTALYSILARTTGMVPEATVNAALNYYSTEDAKTGLFDYVRENLAAVMAGVAVVALVILALVLHAIRADRRISEGEQLISATQTDELTGLYHRSFFFEYVNRMIREHPDRPMDAVVLNIEQFHSVNELNGRDFGDRVLRAIGADMLDFLAGVQGIGGWFGSDRFNMFCTPQDDYQALLDRFQENLNQVSRGASIRLRMGVMPWLPGQEPVLMFDRAKTACSRVRGSERHLMVYDNEMQMREMRDQRLLNDLGRALEDHEFMVYFQPKFNIQCDPPRLSSAEALVRWLHPDLGMVMPGDFIPLFERNGQIIEIDEYVWAESARQIARWRDEYGVTVPVSVNLSRVDVLDPALEETLDGLMAKHSLGRGSLYLEVTESAYTKNADQLNDVIQRLREKGYAVEMDDFGSGYSSLNMLSSMPIDVLKMDRAFINSIEHSEKDVRLVELILDIARNLKVPVVAEGVETEAQLRLLKKMGCAIVQGYYFSRPLPATEFENEIIRRYAGR